MGYPAWARLVVGAAEVAGALALLVPATRPYAATGLAALMLGAIATHLRIGEVPQSAFPLVLALLASTIAWTARPARRPFAGARPAAE